MSRKDSLDDFWDLDKLIPESKRRELDEKLKMADQTLHTYDTSPVEVIIKAKEYQGGEKLQEIEMRPDSSADNYISFREKSEEVPKPDEEYTPENPFIKNVKLFRRKDFAYYSAFYEDGIGYLSVEGEPCSAPRYFSYVPQYSQLDRNMLAFYFYMRTSLRKGEPINADYSYILLYIFELLNVEPQKEKALSQLALVWRAYRKEFPRLDPLMKEWITDFCLVNRLTPNREILGSAYEAALSGAIIKELFICAGKSREETLMSAELAHAFLELCSNYDWRKSKFATEENKPLFEKHIIGAIRAVLALYGEKQKIFIGTSALKRNAFMNSLCTPNNKYRIEVTYSSLARSHEMRFLITDVIKHTENRIRAYLGIKSRLTVYSLPIEIRKIIDDYMDSEIGRKKAPKKEEPGEYEKLYDIPKREFSLENAKRIESDSWKTTQKLIEAFAEEDEPEEALREQPASPSMEDVESLCDEERLIKALEPFMEFVRASFFCDAVLQREISKKMGKLPDSLADEINEIAFEIYGDIVLEKDGDAYRIIEDYKEVFQNA